MSGKISASLSVEQKAEVLAKIEEIKALLPFAINLSPAEKQTLPKMSDGSIAFVTKALEFAETNPKLVPPYLDIAEYRKDFDLAIQLKSISRSLSQLSEIMDDTLTAAGSEALQVALGFYNSAKQASKVGVPGSDAIVEELKKRFSSGTVVGSQDSVNTES